jgi:capsular exopolysaccharide synthesis family protein
VSKLFEIMSSGKGEIPDLVRPMVDVERGPAPPASTGTKGNADVPEMGPEAEAAGMAALPGKIRTLSLAVAAHSPLLPFEPGQWRASEQYRILRTKIVQHPKQSRMIVVSSPAAGDGKSVSAINTAAALSLKSESQVLLLDADFRKSALHYLLGLPESPGLTEVLRGTCTMEQAMVRAQEFPNLFVVSAGATPANPVELLDSAAWQTLSRTLRSQFRYIVVDSPPVGAVADYDLIQAVCDGVILVVRPDHTNRQLCKASLATVPEAKLLGVLLNCVPDWWLARRGQADHYYYYSSEKSYEKNEPKESGVGKGGGQATTAL